MQRNKNLFSIIFLFYNIIYRTVRNISYNLQIYDFKAIKFCIFAITYQGNKMRLTFGYRDTVCEIVEGRGSIASVGNLVGKEHNVLVVTDSGVPVQYAKSVLAQFSNASPSDNSSRGRE